LILRTCFILGHNQLEHHPFTEVTLICQTPTQLIVKPILDSGR
jgi:hypothetical protein